MVSTFVIGHAPCDLKDADDRPGVPKRNTHAPIGPRSLKKEMIEADTFVWKRFGVLPIIIRITGAMGAAMIRKRRRASVYGVPPRSLLCAAVTLFGVTALLAAQEPSRPEGLVPQAPTFEMPSPVTPIPPPHHADSPRVQLGKALFDDTRLSADGRISCATCHRLAEGGDDGQPVSTGVGGAKGQLNTPTVFNAVFNLAQFWDGRAATLHAQIRETLQAPDEMAVDLGALPGRLQEDRQLAERFRSIYPDGVTSDNVIDAIAAYVEVLVTTDAPFDLYLRGDQEALSAEAREGFMLFSRLGCLSCHQGRNLGGNLYQTFGVMGDYFADRGDVRRADLGRYNVTGRETDRHKFKVPSLRNVAQTAPYFHDGSVGTLEEAVQTMVTYELGRPATPVQVEYLVAFLESLSGQIDEALR